MNARRWLPRNPHGALGWSRPDFVKPFDDKAKDVKAEEGARENLELQLIQVPADAAQ